MLKEIVSNSIVEHPLLSVWVITFNHKLYIEGALQSILNQGINVPYEIVISDDCSTDGTTDLCKRYQFRYPNQIRLFLSDKNRGYETNFFDTFSKCRGTYIAMLEGDDYWCENRQIEEQISYLENDNTISGVCGNFYIKDEHNNTFLPFYTELPWGKDVLPIEDLLKVWTIHINTLVFRKTMLDTSVLIQETKCADIALAILLAEKAPIKYINKMYAVWRKHSSGFSNSLTKDIKTIYRHKKTYLDFFNQLYDYKYDKVIRAQFQWDYEDWFVKLKQNFEIKSSFDFFVCFFRKEYYKMPLGFKNKLVYLFPNLYLLYRKIR